MSNDIKEELHKRIKQAAHSFNDDKMLGQTVYDQHDQKSIMHHLTLYFDTGESPLVSRLDRKAKSITFFLRGIEKMLPENPSNSILTAVCGRIILREVYWFIKGTEDFHETSLELITSKRQTEAFLEGLAVGEKRKLEQN